MKKNLKKLPQIKKEIRDFLSNEEGKIVKKDIVKIGLSLIALSAIFPSESSAQHANYLTNENKRGRHTSHSSHASHASHASHGSHCNGIHMSGW